MARPKTDEVVNRQAQVRELLVVHGMTTLEIAGKLFDAGELPSEGMGAAHRLIRSDVKTIRDGFSVEQVLAINTPAETEHFIARMEYVLRQAARELEKMESVLTSRTKLPNGKEIATAKKVDRAGVRQRWAEKYMQAAKAIAAVRGVPIEAWRQRQRDDERQRDQGSEMGNDAPFVFETSGKSQDELIADNLAKGQVN